MSSVASNFDDALPGRLAGMEVDEVFGSRDEQKWTKCTFLACEPPHIVTDQLASASQLIGYKENGERTMSDRYRIARLLTCFAFVTALLGCAATQKRESTGEYVDDSVLTTKVKAAILEEATLKTFQINVNTFKGVVQLSGFVDSAEYVTRAGEVAGHVPGVKEVKNDLVAK